MYTNARKLCYSNFRYLTVWHFSVSKDEKYLINVFFVVDQ